MSEPRRRWMLGAIAAGASAAGAFAQMPATQPAATTGPTTAPATLPANDYERLLGSDNDSTETPLLPTGKPTIDRSSGKAAVAPGAPIVATVREGVFMIDRVGRLTRTPDGQSWEFNFLADGQAMSDPPMRVLPNQKLSLMEDELQTAGRDLKFRISFTVTEYRGRNYALIDKALVVRDPT